MRRLLPLLALAALLLPRPERGAADPTPRLARITAHRIDVRFEPARHWMIARDLVDLDVSAGRALAYRLGPGLEVLSARPVGTAVEGTGAPAPTAGTDGTRILEVPVGVAQAEIVYAGEVFDAVTRKEDLSWVVGDSTRGLVSEKGIYLTGATGWYPRGEQDALARFDVLSYVPAPFLVVTQGGVPERSTLTAPKGWASGTAVAPAPQGQGEPGTAYAVALARAVLPTDDCSLSAGPYQVQQREVEGILVSTYFLEGEAKDAGLWLDAACEVVRRYEPILGSYPHPKFDVVENFFSTGYGMPSYTLLGDDVIRYVTQGAKGSGGRIPPGYLDHEYVHGWYGNGLFVDPSDGNWCEGLTTYFSNYLAKEQESPEAGLEHRRGVLEKYAIRVSGEKDYPVRQFKGKTEDKDNDIGYGKASMVFHMLRRRLGDAEFFARVKSFTHDRAGTNVSWTDWLKALDGEWVRPWLERTGLPPVRLASATAWPGSRPGTWLVHVEALSEVARGEAPWPAMDLDVDVDGRTVGRLRLEGKSGVWRGEVEGEPRSVEIDPRYEVLRKIADADLPPGLNRTLESPKARVSFGEPATVFEPLARRMAREKGLEIVDAKAASEPGRPLVWLHVVAQGEAVKPAMDQGGPVEIRDGAIGVDGKTYEGPDHSILVSFLAKGVPQTWFVALSEKAAARAAYLTYYGWDQFVVFKAGQRTPVARGFLSRDPTGTRRAVARGGEAAVRVQADVDRLANDFGGRRPGTVGHEAANVWLSKRLEALAPDANARWNASFPLGVADLLSSRDLIVTSAAGRETIKDAFRPVFASPPRPGGAALAYGAGEGAVAAPLAVEEASAQALEGLWARVEKGAAPAVLVAPSKAARAALAPLLDAPDALTPEAQAEIARPGHDGKPRPRPDLPIWISGRRARMAGAPTAPLRVPVLVLEEEAAARLAATKDVTSIDFEVRFGPEGETWATGQGGRNLFAYWPGVGAPSERPPVVVLSAHYDALGQERSETCRGADDNASGVACVLEAARGLAGSLRSAGAKTGVLLALFDGEEWGLCGSRAAVGPLGRAYDVRAVVNVDAVGRMRDDTVFVLGLSTVPPLATKAAGALARAGLAVGRDIDRYGYAEGSDHWPFHQAGIPAITFWASDYGVMNTTCDDPQDVDCAGVARLAGAVGDLVLRLVTE